MQKRCGIKKLKKKGKPHKCLREVSADEKGRLIQAVAYCGISPTEGHATTGKIRRIVELLEEID